MRARSVVLLVLAATSCRRAREEARPDPVAADARVDVLALYPPPRRPRWRERSEASGKVTTERVEETWTEVKPGPGATRAFIVVPRQPDREAELARFDAGWPRSETRYELRSEGLVMIETSTDGVIQTYDPPFVVLPSDVRPGVTFGGEHRAPKVVRECHVKAYGSCAQGIEVVCRLAYASGYQLDITRRYCGGVGWVGLERIDRDEKGTVRASRAEDFRDD